MKATLFFSCLAPCLSVAALASTSDAPPPRGLPIEGTPVAQARFSDKTGEHIVLVTETEVTTSTDEAGEEVRNKRLFGYHFTKTKEGYKQLWQTRDFVLRCPVDLTLEYVKGSLQVSDVDDDGLKESRFAYELACRGDVSPSGLKLLLHEGATKYAVRGESIADLGEVDDDGRPVVAGGKGTLDPALKAAPAAIRALAVKTWRELTRGGEAR